jgi:hypothetical protein
MVILRAVIVDRGPGCRPKGFGFFAFRDLHSCTVVNGACTYNSFGVFVDQSHVFFPLLDRLGVVFCFPAVVVYIPYCDSGFRVGKIFSMLDMHRREETSVKCRSETLAYHKNTFNQCVLWTF